MRISETNWDENHLGRKSCGRKIYGGQHSFYKFFIHETNASWQKIFTTLFREKFHLKNWPIIKTNNVARTAKFVKRADRT